MATSPSSTPSASTQPPAPGHADTSAPSQPQQQQQQIPLLEDASGGGGGNEAAAAAGAGAGVTQRIDLSSGDGSVRLDHLGPLVVNVDGTLSRIGNWAQMSEVEKQNTLRVLGKRNQARLAKLRAQGESGADGGEPS
jgi:hypothetical protein